MKGSIQLKGKMYYAVIALDGKRKWFRGDDTKKIQGQPPIFSLKRNKRNFPHPSPLPQGEGTKTMLFCALAT